MQIRLLQAMPPESESAEVCPMQNLTFYAFKFHLSAIFCALLAFCFQKSFAQEPENITNDSFQTNFRPGHSLSVYAGVQRATWKVVEAGAISPEMNAGRVSYLPSMLVRYGFHINIRKKFGFIVGTSAGGYFETTNIQGFKPKSSVLFPSLGIGLVQWPEPTIRITGFAEYSALWYPGMKTRAATGTNSSASSSDLDISSIADAALLSATFDWFAWKRSGVGVLFGWRFVDDGLIGGNNSSRESTVDFKNNGFFTGINYSMQLGDAID
jgi:hypothetical protein